MKLLTIVVPCYNSANYMEHCVETLLYGGEEVEILVVDDGSTKDATPKIADRLEKEHPGIVRAIHQENKGHGGAVNTGIANAKGKYIKIVDSDDWVSENAYRHILNFLRKVCEEDRELDMLISNFVYEKEGAERKKVMRYHKCLPKNRFFTWEDVKKFNVGEYILMHSVIYKTEVLRESGLCLPEHTFYVDNIYVYHPLPFVKTMYYLDVNFYRYFIGREDQSVNETVMISRIDQQMKVNHIMVESYDLEKLENVHLRNYMYHYLEIITVITSILLLRIGTKESIQRKKELWAYIKETNPAMYRKLRYGKTLGYGINMPGPLGRRIAVAGYKISQKVFGFN